MAKQCLFFWNGKEADGGGDFTLQPGITPSQAIMRFRLSYGHDQYGTLTLSDGQQVRHFRNCRLSRMVVTDATGGRPRWREVTVMDRRWSWEDRFSAVYGNYNVPILDGQIRRSAQQLGTICARALNIQRFDVGNLPANSYPPTQWDALNPAIALDQLARQYGCFVTLDTNDRLFIAKEGFGRRPVNDSRAMDFSTSAEPPVIPRYLATEGVACLVQHDWWLEAVGEENHGPNFGRMVPINELSYKPATGWEREPLRGPQAFGNLLPQGNTDLASCQRLAKEHVYRTYRIGTYFHGRTGTGYQQYIVPIIPSEAQSRIAQGRLPSGKKSQDFIRYFTITDSTKWRIQSTTLQAEACNLGIPNVSYQIIGYCNQHDPTAPLLNTGGLATLADVQAANPYAFQPGAIISRVPAAANNLVVKQTHKFDPEKNEVQFNEPMYFSDNVPGDNRNYPALIRLRTGAYFRDLDSAAFLCPQYWLKTGGATSTNVVKLIKDSSLRLDYGFVGLPGNARVSTWDQPAFIQQSLALMNSEINKYQFPQGASIPYKSFAFDFTPDGIIKAVSFTVSEQGLGKTFVDYGMERPDNYLTLEELRRARFATWNEWFQLELERKKQRNRP